ncbi:uncharacterized protein KZ484_009063 [Pholidichthys leucotaenia]
MEETSKPGEKVVHHVNTDQPEDKEKPQKKSEGDESIKLDESSDQNQNFKHFPDPESKRSETAGFTPKPNQKSPTVPVEKSDENPSHEPKFIQESTPGPETTTDHVNIPDDQKPKIKPSIPKPGQERKPDQNRYPFQKPKYNEKPVNPVHKPTSPQRPLTANSTRSGKYPTAERDSNKISVTEETSKPGEKVVHHVNTDQPEDKEKPQKKSEDDENIKIDESSDQNQNFKHFPDPESKRSETAGFTSKPNQKSPTVPVEKSDENPSHESKFTQESTPGPEVTIDHVNMPDKQKPKFRPSDPKPDQEPKPEEHRLPFQKPKSNEKPVNPVRKPTAHPQPPNVNSTRSNKYPPTEGDSNKISGMEETSKSGEKVVHPVNIDQPDDKEKPQKKSEGEKSIKLDESSDQNQNFKHFPDPESKRSETAGVTPKPNQKSPTVPVEKSDENPSHEPKFNQESTLESETTADQVNNPDDQKPKFSPSIPKPDQEHKTSQEPKLDPSRFPFQKPNYNEKPVNPVHKPTSYQRPPNVNSTRSDKYPPTERDSNKISVTEETSKPGEKVVHHVNTDQPEDKEKNGEKSESDESFHPDDSLDQNQNLKHFQDPDSKRSETAGFTLKPNQKSSSVPVKKSDGNPSHEPKFTQDSTSGPETTTEYVNMPDDQKPKFRPSILKPGHQPKPNQNKVPFQKPKSDEKYVTPIQRPKYNQSPSNVNTTRSGKFPQIERDSDKTSFTDKTPKHREKVAHTLNNGQPKKKQNPGKTPKSEESLKPDKTFALNQDPETTRNETEGLTQKPYQKPQTDLVEKSDENPLHEPNFNQESTPGPKTLLDRVNATHNQKDKLIPKASQKPKDLTPEKSKVPFQKPKYKEKPIKPIRKPTSPQRPPNINTTKSDEYPSLERDSNTISVTEEKSKPGEKVVHHVNTDQPEDKEKPVKKPESDESIQPDESSDQSKDPIHFQDPESKRSEKTGFKPKLHQKESVEKSRENPSQESKFDPKSTPGPKSTLDHLKVPHDEKPNFNHSIPKTSQEHTTDPNRVPFQQPKSNEKSVTPIHNNTARHMPQNVNITRYKYPSTDGELDEISNADETSKPRREDDKHPETGKPEENVQNGGKPKSEENTKPDEGLEINKELKDPVSKSSETATFTPKPTQKPSQKPKSEFVGKKHPLSNEDSTAERKMTPKYKPKPSLEIPKMALKPNPGQVPTSNQEHPKTKFDVNPKTGQAHQINQNPNISRPGRIPIPDLVPNKVLETQSNKTSKTRLPSRYGHPRKATVKPGATSIKRPKPTIYPQPSPNTRAHLDPPQISWTTSDIQDSQNNLPPTAGPEKQTVTHAPRDTEFTSSMRKTTTLAPKTASSREAGHVPHLHTVPEHFTVSPNSRIISDLRPQQASQLPLIPVTTRPNKIMRGIIPSIIPSTSPGSMKPNVIPESESSLQAKSQEETAPTITTVPPPTFKSISTVSPHFRSLIPANAGSEPPVESSTPSARELRVKINQVPAFLHNSLNPNGNPLERHPKEDPEEREKDSRPDRTGSRLPTLKPSKVTIPRRDCSDLLLRGERKSGVYLVAPDPRAADFPVFCDMEREGGGWTLLQRRQDGSVSFNRSWAEYRSGFGKLDGGEFWLGNSLIHLLTHSRDTELRVELEDFHGVREYARYEHFRVASERLRFRLTVGGYSGTAGDALRFSRTYDHHNRAFTTPDRDNDRYPSGNCGAYYSSGWWFDACMAANLNGRYYAGGRYRGVRDGIFWGTWHNITSEYYPTNERQSFKKVRMMIRPKGFAP